MLCVSKLLISVCHHSHIIITIVPFTSIFCSFSSSPQLTLPAATWRTCSSAWDLCSA